MFNRKNRTDDLSSKNMDAYVEERLSEYLDGTLNEQERNLVEAYLATSERARESLEALRYTVNLLKQTPAPALPRQFTLPVTSRAPAQTAPSWLVWTLRGVAVATTAAFVILLTATLLRSPDLSQTANAPAMQAPPSVVIALAPTPTTQPASAPAPASDDSSTSPAMITVPAPSTPEIIPITLTPPSIASEAHPTQAKVSNQDVPPSSSQEPTDSFTTQMALPTPAATQSAPSVNPAGGNAPESQPVTSTPTTTGEAQTQRTMLFDAAEGVVTASQLRVRRGPGTHYRAIGGLKRGDKVFVIGRSSSGGWLVIQYPQNLETGRGWIGATFVELNMPLEALPIFQAPDATENEPTLETPTDTPTATQTPTALDENDGERATPEPSATDETLLTPTPEPESAATVQVEGVTSPSYGGTPTPPLFE